MVIKSILEKLSGVIDSMVAEIVAEHIKVRKSEPTKFDIEMYRLGLTYDMVRSIEKYVITTDGLASLSWSWSIKGNLTVSIEIERDGQNHVITTDAIYAGGHNIQKLHYRYIVKTKLSKLGDQSASNAIKGKMTTIKIQADIDDIKYQIADQSERVAKAELMSDAEIIESIKNDTDDDWSSLLNTTWEEIKERRVSRYATEADWNTSYAELLVDVVVRWKRYNIAWGKENISIWNKHLVGLQKKLEKHEN
jgi:hypothetical protein